jgi:DNA-binding protein HU-beta
MANESAPLTRAERKVLNEAADIIKAKVGEGRITLLGFGTFKVKTRAARKGRNPATGESLDIPEKRVISFKMNADLCI